MNAGVVALISIAGLGWLGSSFFEGNRSLIIASISGVVQQHAWVFAFGLFALSILLSSQAATVVTLMPVGVALGLGAPAMIAMFPAVNGYFFLPTYATLACGNLVRPDWHHEDREIRAEPQLHATRTGSDDLVGTDRLRAGEGRFVVDY